MTLLADNRIQPPSVSTFQVASTLGCLAMAAVLVVGKHAQIFAYNPMVAT